MINISNVLDNSLRRRRRPPRRVLSLSFSWNLNAASSKVHVYTTENEQPFAQKLRGVYVSAKLAVYADHVGNDTFLLLEFAAATAKRAAAASMSHWES